MATSPTAAARPADSPLAGIGLMALGVSIVPLMDGIAKYLSADYPVMQIVWGRFTFHLIWLLPLLLLIVPRGSLLAVRSPLLQLVRGGFLLGATLCFFGAIKFIPIADALALLFISPMVCTLLSPWVLGEHVGMWRWIAVAAGFVGALIVVRPGFGVFHWASLLALGAGALHGCYLVSTRLLAGSTHALVTLFYTALVGALAMSLVAPVVWVTPDARGWILFLLMGLIAAVGHFLIIRSFDRAPAPVVAPVGYAEIVMATIVGYVAFSDFPDPWTWVGIAVIVGSGILISVREHRRNRPIPPLGESSGAVH